VTLVATRSEGLLFLDSLVAMCCAAYATSASSVALRRAIEGLMDASVGEEETTLIRSTIEAVDGVLEVSRVVAIRCGRATHVTASISLARSTPMTEAGRIRDHIALAVERQTGDVTEVLVAFEPRDTGARRSETERGRP
jgi:divalent metal cation (Fe/Co/Zn/Cd) transporter